MNVAHIGSDASLKQSHTTTVQRSKVTIFTVGAASHPHGAVVAAVCQPAGQSLCLKGFSIVLESVQEQTGMSVVDL